MTDVAPPASLTIEHTTPLPLIVRTLGIVPYDESLAEQRRLHAERVAGSIPDTLLLLEHPHVYTLGRRSDPGHILVDEGFLHAHGATIAHNERGGEVTYHGPGQLVAYPIMLLQPAERSITSLVRRMEAVIAATLGEFGLEASLVLGEPGVWVNGRKIASIGMAVRRWVVLHGMALNVDPDLTYFSYINPCGHAGLQVTSLARELGAAPSMESVHAAFARQFAVMFGRTMAPEVVVA
jgi:lipoate-protein ligase B